MRLSDVLHKPLFQRTGPSESGLRANSPVRAWLARRREHAAQASGTALLAALTTPDIGWADREVGYAALRNIDLTEPERIHATYLLVQALTPFHIRRNLLRGLGNLVIPLGVTSLIISLLATPDYGLQALGFGMMGISALPVLVFTILQAGERRRTLQVQRVAATTLAQIGGPEGIVALGSHVIPNSPVREEYEQHPLRRWMTQYETNPTTANNADLLNALAFPCASTPHYRAKAYQVLGRLTLSPSERAQANHLLIQALKFAGSEGVNLRRIGHASAQALLCGLGIGGMVTLAVCFQGILGELITPAYLLNSLAAGFGFAGWFTMLTTPLFFLRLHLTEPAEIYTVQKAAIATAAEIGGPECIVVLYDNSVYDTRVRTEALSAIRKLLPTVTEDWYGRWPAGSGYVLLKLAQSDDAALAIAALDALGRAGGSEAIKEVTRIAETSLSKPVRKRAAYVLGLLLRKRSRETEGASLLRASQPSPSEQLLHPVYSTDLDTSNLLRASHGNLQDPE